MNINSGSPNLNNYEQNVANWILDSFAEETYYAPGELFPRDYYDGKMDSEALTKVLNRDRLMEYILPLIPPNESSRVLNRFNKISEKWEKYQEIPGMIYKYSQTMLRKILQTKYPNLPVIEAFVRETFGEESIYNSKNTDNYTLSNWAFDNRQNGDYFLHKASQKDGIEKWDIIRFSSPCKITQHQVNISDNGNVVSMWMQSDKDQNTLFPWNIKSHFGIENSHACPPNSSNLTDLQKELPIGFLTPQLNVNREWNSLVENQEDRFKKKPEDFYVGLPTSDLCLKDGIVSMGYTRPFNANKIGKDPSKKNTIDTEYQFVASQYPIVVPQKKVDPQKKAHSLLRFGMPTPPLARPENENVQRFWDYIFYSTGLIFDLVEVTNTKLPHYYPESSDVPTLHKLPDGSINVQLLKEESIGEHIKKSTYELTRVKVEGRGQEKNETMEKQTVTRIHCFDWPDGDVISLETLDELVSIFEEMTKQTNSKEGARSADQIHALIHCKMGLGRTGTLITAILLKEAILKENSPITLDNLDVNLSTLVNRLKLQRYGAVQTLPQLQFLHDYATTLLKRKASGGGKEEV